MHALWARNLGVSRVVEAAELAARPDCCKRLLHGRLIVPSMFEPCGLAPLIAMRYGTVAVVRATGGMTDTVFDYNHSTRLAYRAAGS